VRDIWNTWFDELYPPTPEMSSDEEEEEQTPSSPRKEEKQEKKRFYIRKSNVRNSVSQTSVKP